MDNSSRALYGRALAIVGVCALLLEPIGGCRQRDKHSKEQIQIQQEITTALKVGDSEQKLESYLAKRGWPAKFDAGLNGYYWEIKEENSFLERHSILIHFTIQDHKIADIGVMDSYVTL